MAIASRIPRPSLTLLEHRAIVKPRAYATQTSLGTSPSSEPKRHKPVTVFNDTGRVPWGQLSPAEKAARTTQQTFNFGLIATGAVLTLGVAYFLWTDVFSPSSATVQFNASVSRVKSDPRCVELLGDASKITAFGEASWNRWRRNRPIASRVETDKMGTERMFLHFNVQGPKNNGVVSLFMLRRHDEHQFHFGHLALDVPGHSRIWVENAGDGDKKAPGKFLGVRWTR